jgi:hypothetical protein
MGSALANDDSFDQRTAPMARFSCSLVDAEVVLEIAPTVNPVDACTTVV